MRHTIAVYTIIVLAAVCTFAVVARSEASAFTRVTDHLQCALDSGFTNDCDTKSTP